MQLENAKLRCECGGRMKNMITKWKGINVKGWKCQKCGEELLNPVDSQKAMEIIKAKEKKEFDVKLRTVGKSKVVTVPHLLAEFKNLKDGKILKWGIKGDQFTLGIKD